MPQEIGLCFVSRDNWLEYCRISDDIPNDSNYDTFLQSADKFCDNIASDGGVAVKIDVDPIALIAWARREGVHVNSNSRSRYAAMQLIKKNNEGNSHT